MYLFRGDNFSAVVPGFLLGYRGDVMMPEYGRYMKMLPFFMAANAVSCAVSAYGLVLGTNRYLLMAYAIFMAAFSARLLTQRLVRVGFRRVQAPVVSAPLTVRVNACLVAATLAMMGAGFLRMDGEFDTVLFKAFGALMVVLSAACLLALRRSNAG